MYYYFFLSSSLVFLDINELRQFFFSKQQLIGDTAVDAYMVYTNTLFLTLARLYFRKLTICNINTILVN